MAASLLLIALQVFTVTQTALSQANPTHYGDPKTGCMRDEGRHWGGGLSGWYCSPVCKWDEANSSNDIPCPEDMPSGVTARPGCTDMDDDTGYGICTLICSPSALSLNGANGECGTGTCESFPGSSTGECRYGMPYAEPPELALPPVLIGAEMIQANPTHYGDPKTGCESDEQSVKVQGLSGDFCSAACKGSVCPTDKPSGATAKPTCALKTTTGSQYCALICSPSALSLNGANGECGTGTCQSVQGTGICTYATSTKLALSPATMGAEMIQAGGPSVIV